MPVQLARPIAALSPYRPRAVDTYDVKFLSLQTQFGIAQETRAVCLGVITGNCSGREHDFSPKDDRVTVTRDWTSEPENRPANSNSNPVGLKVWFKLGFGL